MLQKEVTVSEIWVPCMLHNWCASLYAQYGPRSLLQITLWAPFFSPYLSPLPLPSSHVPVPPSPPKSYLKRLLWVATAWLLFLFALRTDAAFVGLCVRNMPFFPWTGMRIVLEGVWHRSRFLFPFPWPFLPFCTIHCCLPHCFGSGYLCLRSHLQRFVPGPYDVSVYPALGFVLCIHCLLATCSN